MTNRALKGIRVIELGQYIALPLIGRLLGALGAEVIKVETNRSVDPMSAIPPGTNGAGASTWHGGKRRVSLDVRTPEGKRIFERLVAISDIFITNTKRHTLARWGIDFPRLKEIKQDIIIAQVTAMGGEGPYSEYTGYGGSIAPLCGVSSLTGMPGPVPVMLASGYSDYHTPIFMAMAIISALMRRQHTGEGETIEGSVFTAGAATIGPSVLDYQANGRMPKRIGNSDPYAAPHGIYKCRGEDRWCAIAVFNDTEWDSFCQVLDNPQWTCDPRYSSPKNRIENAEVLDYLIGQWTADRTAEEIVEMMQRAGIASGIVFQGEDQVKDAHIKERGFFRESVYYETDFSKPQSDWEERGPAIVVPIPPILLNETPCSFGRYHRFSEDNQYVYSQLLGMSSIEIDELTEKGVLS